MYIIVGLGNPGLAYRSSRHNAGFMALDALSKRLHIRLYKRAHKAIVGEGMCSGQKVLLAKPQTFMNLSGESIRALLSYYKIPEKNLIVLYDDIDLPAGSLRIRASGSAGTHNGMRSIIACLGGEEGFPRVRIGVGRQQDHRPLAAHVLGKPGKEELHLLKEACEFAGLAAELIVAGQLAEAQARFNQKGGNK